MQSNRMTALLNKIERRLGTRALNLPDYLTKDKWATEVIENETYYIYLSNDKVKTLDQDCIRVIVSNDYESDSFCELEVTKMLSV